MKNFGSWRLSNSDTAPERKFTKKFSQVPVRGSGSVFSDTGSDQDASITESAGASSSRPTSRQKRNSTRDAVDRKCVNEW